MKLKPTLSKEQVNRLYSGLHEYVNTDPLCPNCRATTCLIEEHETYTTYTCTDCGYDYYAIDGETRLI